MAHLSVLKGNQAGKALTLPVYPCVLGRDEGCDLVLDDPRASRQHACFRLQGGTWQIRDLETANGTWVDGRKTEDWTDLRPGARVRIGRTELRLDDADASAPRREEPLVLPGYEILGAVGQGATGVVYRARQVSLDRPVAIKVLAPSLARQGDYVERFVQEARAAAALSHPHVVPVFDVARHGPHHYFTMEFMEGGTVEDRLLAAPGSRLPWPEAVRLVSDAAAGLAYLHERGFVHRDIKPANLLLDAKGTVKLGDLGTVVRVDEGANARIGTPHFMSPEQATRQPVTRASDVYSLGATLYRMLAGTTPHHGTTKREIIENVASTEPAPVESLCPGLPDEVIEEVRAMMARDPARRPTDAAVVGRRLAAAVEGVRTTREDARRTRRRRTAVSGVLTSILLVLFVGAVAWAVWTWRGEIGARLGRGQTSAQPAPVRTSAPPEPVPEPVRPAQLAAATFREIQDRERALDPPIRANAATWREIAEDYARLADVFPLDDETVVRAHWRSREILDRLVRVTGGDAENSAFAERWVANALRDVGGAETPALAPDADVPILATAPEVITLRTKRDALLARADALVAKGRVQEALDAVLAWVRENRLAATRDRAPTEVHETIAGGIQWMRRTTRTQSARLESDLDRDRGLLRTHLAATSCFTGPGGAHDFDAALARIDHLKPLLLTYLGAERADARRARVAAMRAAWEAMLVVAPVVAPAHPTPDAWRDAVAEVVAGGVERVPREHRVAAARLLAEADRLDAAEKLLARHPEIADADRASVRAEIAARRDFRGLGPRAAPADVAAWTTLHAATDASFLLAPRTGGAHPVFSRDDTDGYFESWGGRPPEER